MNGKAGTREAGSRDGDWLTERLHRAAETAFDSAPARPLEDPSRGMSDGADQHPDPSVVHLAERPPSGNRRAPLLGLVAALLLVVLAGAWLLWDGTDSVSSLDPAGPDGDPGAPQVDSEEPMQSEETRPPAEVVAEALENTLSTSWVAEVEVGNEDPDVAPSSATVTYHPADPVSGRPYNTVLMEGPALDRAELALSGEPRVVDECAESDMPPCRPGAWAVQGSWNAQDYGVSEDGYRDRMEAAMTLLPNVDPTSATPVGDGAYEVVLSALDPCDVNCTARIQVADGRVVSFMHPDMGGRLVMDFRSFGDAPAVQEPASSDIVEGPLRPGTLCEVTLHVAVDTDTAAVEQAVRELESQMGNTDGAALMRAIREVPGVDDVSTTTGDGATCPELRIGFVANR